MIKRGLDKKLRRVLLILVIFLVLFFVIYNFSQENVVGNWIRNFSGKVIIEEETATPSEEPREEEPEEVPENITEEIPKNITEEGITEVPEEAPISPESEEPELGPKREEKPEPEKPKGELEIQEEPTTTFEQFKSGFVNLLAGIKNAFSDLFGFEKTRPEVQYASCDEVPPEILEGKEGVEVTSCGTLSQSNAYYLLINDVISDRVCLSFGIATNYVVDLNGYTITYSNLDFVGVENPGFEEGGANPQIPAGWDLSHAPNAYRQDYTQKLFFDNYSLHMENLAGEEYVLSSPVYLPAAGRYAAFTQIQGGPSSSVRASIDVEGVSVVCDNGVSNVPLEYSGTDMSIGIICEFEVTESTTVRAKITIESGEINIDEADIRPIGDSGIETSGGDTQEVKNGEIIEGKSEAIYSPAIKTRSNSKIHDLTIITNGINSQNIYGKWRDDVEVYNNYLESNGKLPLHRHYGFGMIDFERTSGGIKIYDNTLVNGSHYGIYAYPDRNFGSYEINPKRSEIYNNEIRLRVVATNGYSILASTNTTIHDNTIQPIQGHGIDTKPHQTIYNNLIEPRTWPCSEYSDYWYPNSAHAIRMKTYGSGYMFNVSVFNNSIIGKTNSQLPNCYTEIAGITNYITDNNPGTYPDLGDNKIYNNNVSVETDDYQQQHALAYKNGGTAEVYNNTFKSNHIIVEMSDKDSSGGKNTNLVSNTLIKGENPNGFNTLRYGYWQVLNNTFLDTKLLDGADLRDIYHAWSYYTDLIVSWYLRVEVVDNTGTPIESAEITIYDKDNNLINSFTTGPSGEITTGLKEYVYYYDPGVRYVYYSPYSVSVTYNGETQTEIVELDESKTLTFTFGGGAPDNPPTVTLNYPDDNYITNSDTIDFSADAYDDNQLVNVSIYIDDILDQTDYSGVNGEYIFTQIFSNGTYSWKVEACDNANQCTMSNIRTFIVGGYCGDGLCNAGETCSSCPEDCGECPSGGGNGGGGGGGGKKKNKYVEEETVNELTNLLLKDNWKLIQAMERFLGKNLSEEDVEKMIAMVPNVMNGTIPLTKKLETFDNESEFTARFIYSGDKKTLNLFVYEVHSKYFVPGESITEISALGGEYEIVEFDPSYLFYYPEIYPGQIVEVVYHFNKVVDFSDIESVLTSIYAADLEDVVCNSNGVCERDIGENSFGCRDDCPSLCVPDERRCMNDNLEVCNILGEAWKLEEECEYGCDKKSLICKEKKYSEVVKSFVSEYLFIFIILIAIIAVFVYLIYKKQRPKRFSRFQGK